MNLTQRREDAKMKRSAMKLVIAALAGVVVGNVSVGATIKLRDRVVLAAPVVRLGDVAIISANDGDQRRKLAALLLMPAPAPGTQRFLQQREVADLLNAHGIDMRNVRMAGAEQVEISSGGDDRGANRPPQVTSTPVRLNRHAAILAGKSTERSVAMPDPGRAAGLQEALNQIITSYLKSKVDRATTWQVTSEVAERHAALLASSRPEISGGNPPWTGRQRFIATIRTTDGKVQLPIYAEVVAVSTPVVVALEPIGRGEPITAAKIALQAVDYLPEARGRRAAARSVDELIGMEARQSIRAGEVIFADQVQAPVLVKRGETITISSNAGAIRVRTTARAKQDAAQGELVQVETLETREPFEARVVGPREAAVVALSRPTQFESLEQKNIARRPRN
jgi:flagella basal body P-ring formation protein FlgA